MNFTCGMNKSEEATRENRDWIFFVVDVCQVGVGINVVRKRLVANLVKSAHTLRQRGNERDKTLTRGSP